MSEAQKRSLIGAAAQRFVVLGEIGAKDPRVEVTASAWALAATADLGAGATWVVTEGRESGTVGLFDDAGDVHGELVDAILAAVGEATVIFEAPRRAQQAWLLRRIGPNVNLGNIAPDDVIALETLRRGLRFDTLDLLPRGSRT